MMKQPTTHHHNQGWHYSRRGSAAKECYVSAGLNGTKHQGPIRSCCADHLQELFRANLAGPHKSPFELPSTFNDDELLDAWSVCEVTDNTLHVAIA
jgi:hypothetical protein